MQAFPPWIPTEIRDRRALTMKEESEVWQHLRLKHTDLSVRIDDGLFRGKEELIWDMLPQDGVVIVP
jgi:hypothetical protein